MTNILKRISAKIASFLPVSSRDIILSLRRKPQSIKNRLFSKRIEKDVLIKDIKSLGLKQGDTVLIHSAFSKIGIVNGGPATVIDAFKDVVGPNGNIAALPAYL